MSQLILLNVLSFVLLIPGRFNTRQNYFTMKKREVNKSADTGRFVSKEFAKNNPKTTYKTTVGQSDEEE